MTTYDKLYQAIYDGINMERLLIATGLDHHTFNQYLRDELFNHQQLTQIRMELKEWGGAV